jgi:hypothetical protein
MKEATAGYPELLAHRAGRRPAAAWQQTSDEADEVRPPVFARREAKGPREFG